jgi:hypothetical protein
MITDAQLQQAMNWLGIGRDELLHIKTDGSDDQAAVKLLALQARVKKAYKRAVRELHPDRNGGSSEKTALFRAVTEVYKEIGNTELQEADPSTYSERSATVLRASFGGALFEICVSEVI